jgi:acetoin utilization deacetylase AcuC-like enzyme
VSAGLYLSHPSSLEHDPRIFSPGHPEQPARLPAIERALAGFDWSHWQRREAPAAAEVEIELIHSHSHVRAIADLSAAGGGAIDLDTSAGEASYRAARHAAGGACEMVRALLAGEAQVGFCATRPPGHHAEAERAMGFCLFNNVAIAAALALSELDAQRVFILDWDVHHGNGTAEAFRARADVLYASIHEWPQYPGTGPLEDAGSGAGEGYTINLPVPAGSDEELWLSLLDHVVLPAAVAFRPDLVLVSAGFDAHHADPLGGCLLDAGSFALMTKRLRWMASALGVAVGMVLEGGYAPDALGECVRETLTALMGVPVPAVQTQPDPVAVRAAGALSRYWPR